jgi:uncharacterized protein YukE
LEIKINKAKFSTVLLAQQSALTSLRNLYTEQQASFGGLSRTWKGTAGRSFMEAAKELSNQTLMGILMITTLNNQTKTTKTTFETVDKTIARAMKK